MFRRLLVAAFVVLLGSSGAQFAAADGVQKPAQVSAAKGKHAHHGHHHRHHRKAKS